MGVIFRGSLSDRLKDKPCQKTNTLTGWKLQYKNSMVTFMLLSIQRWGDFLEVFSPGNYETH